MPSVLDNIVAHKQQEIGLRKAQRPITELLSVTDKAERRFEKALQPTLNAQTKLILEIKPASPSAGVLAESFELEPILASYNQYASAISVLTDRKFFQGSLELLSEVAQHSPHPVLCKDFVLDPYQVYEARLAGAEAVLLIAKILSDESLQTLHDTVCELGMTPVVEIQNEGELERALALHPSVILINNRNLETFDIHLETTLRLAPQIPDGILRVSASGIECRADIDGLMPVCSTFLIGSILMRTPPKALPQKLQELSGQ